MVSGFPTPQPYICLNESPSEKEGKSPIGAVTVFDRFHASMKVPPKRKGNAKPDDWTMSPKRASMKVPPKRKGNMKVITAPEARQVASMKVPPKRKGNSLSLRGCRAAPFPASMKVPPKRKGNVPQWRHLQRRSCLNESPSEKEGKSSCSVQKIESSLAPQ